MKKRIMLYGVIVILALLLGAAVAGINRIGWSAFFARPITTTNTMVLQQIKEVGKLELVQLEIRDIVEVTKDNQLLPDEKALVVLYGKVAAGIDLEKLKEEDIVLGADSIIIKLPEPEVMSCTVDHTKSHVYDTKMGILSTGGIISAELIDKAYQDGEKNMAERAREMGYEAQVKANAEKLLRPILEKIGNKNVEFKY